MDNADFIPQPSLPNMPTQIQSPRTPKSSERIRRHLEKILEDLDTIEMETDNTNDILPLSPIRRKVKQLASSAITAMAGQAIQKQSNTQLRTSIKNRKSTKLTKLSMNEPGDRTQLTKARVLNSAEGQRLKQLAEAKAVEEASAKQRSDKRKQEKVFLLFSFKLHIVKYFLTNIKAFSRGT